MSEKQFPAGKIRFEIESLGPIRDSVIDFKPFLLFSGESSTGKSYTAMAVYYLFFMLRNGKILSELTNKLFDIRKIEEDLKTKKKLELEIPNSLMDELERVYNGRIERFMAYMLGYDNFSCDVKLKLNAPSASGAKIHHFQSRIERGDFVSQLIADFPQIHSSIGSNSLNIGNIETHMNYLVRVLYMSFIFGQIDYHAFLLPPARGAFSGLTLSMLKEFSGIGMYNEFQEGIDRVRFRSSSADDILEGQQKFVNPLFEQLLNGKIKVRRNNVYYTIGGEKKTIPLTAGSSAVKELFPLYLLANRVPIDRLSICIEEPEAHLHPELQRSVALLLAYIVNHGGLVQVTTHSDFFVNQTNNLLKLHFLKNKDRDVFLKALKETGIQEAFVLNPEDLGAYYFEMVNSKGTVHARKLEVSEKGMPLESFKQAYDQSVKETRNLREALTDELERETGR